MSPISISTAKKGSRFKSRSSPSPPLSPDEASKLSPKFSHATSVSAAKSKLRPRSPPRLAIRSKHSPTSCEHFNLKSLPSSHQEREEYLLNEYDYRMKMHIAYQAESFELQNAIGNKKELTALICKQKNFEQEWPSTRSKDELSSYGEHISITTVDEPREVGMEELIKEAKELIKLLQYTINTKQ